MYINRRQVCAERYIRAPFIFVSNKLVLKYFKIPVPVSTNEGFNPEEKMNNKRKGRGGSTAAG